MPWIKASSDDRNGSERILGALANEQIPEMGKNGIMGVLNDNKIFLKDSRARMVKGKPNTAEMNISAIIFP